MSAEAQCQFTRRQRVVETDPQGRDQLDFGDRRRLQSPKSSNSTLKNR
jgi:hypothetical protein